MAKYSIVLLPKEGYYDWLGAARDYGIRFGVNFTNQPESAGNYMNPNQTVTVVTATDKLAFYGVDIAQWFAEHYPGVRLDVLRADTPDELKNLLAARIAAGDPFAPVQPPEPPPAPKPSRGLTGLLRMKENKPSYAARIENIFFYEEITNHTDQTIPYGIVGVKVTKLTGEGQDFFHTSWSGNLKIGPRCQGPTDECGGGWEDSLQIEAPGTYRLTLDICYSTVDAALSGKGEWETLTPGIDITVVNWTPPG